MKVTIENIIFTLLILIVFAVPLGIIARKYTKNIKPSNKQFIITTMFFTCVVIYVILYSIDKELISLIVGLFIIFAAVFSLIKGIQLRKKGE